MTGEVLSQLAEMPSRRLDEASALAIQQSRTAAVRLWDEITRLLVGDPFTSGWVLPSRHRAPTR